MVKVLADFKGMDGQWVKTITLNGKRFETRAYKLWRNVKRRTYANGVTQRRHPTYVGVSLSENFENFQFFAEWCNMQVGYGVEGFELDKDLLVKGNRVYGEHTCVFLPKKINCALIRPSDRENGSFIGTSVSGDKYAAFASDGNGATLRLGLYGTRWEAFLAYKQYKENYLKKLAEDGKLCLSEVAYKALLQYEVLASD